MWEDLEADVQQEKPSEVPTEKAPVAETPFKKRKRRGPINMNTFWMQEVRRQVPSITYISFVQTKEGDLLKVNLKNSESIKDTVTFKLDVSQLNMTGHEWEYVIEVLKTKSYEHKGDL